MYLYATKFGEFIVFINLQVAYDNADRQKSILPNKNLHNMLIN